MSARRTRRLGVFESLERRQLLHGGPGGGAIELTEGVLHVTGSNKKDTISVLVQEDQLVVVLNKTTHTFNLAEVTTLSIDAGGSHDTVTVDGSVLVDAVIFGGAGNDKIQGGGGNDTIFGGAGNDSVVGGAGDDALHGEAGNDRLQGGLGNDSVHGGAGADDISGGEGDDELLGEAGADKVFGGAGNDWISGGLGHDKLSGEAGDDSVLGDEGHDKLWGGLGLDELFAGQGNDHLFGNEDDDWLDGEAGNDKLLGGDGDDRLKGGLGNDQLNGEAGVNLLDGDEGKNKLRNGTEVDFESLPEEQPALTALLEGPGFIATAQYLPGQPTVLCIQVNSGMQGLGLNVVIDGVTIGQIDLDGEGGGTSVLRFSSDPEDGELPWPAGLDLVVGSTISIGDFTGVFAVAEE